MMPRSLNVVVLYNTDFDTSEVLAGDVSRTDVLRAARRVAQTIEAKGHQATLLGVAGFDVCHSLVQLRNRQHTDLVFNLCESLATDARHELVVPALLELAEIPYTGSGPFTLALALRKDKAKEILRAQGVPTPEAVVLTSVKFGRLPLEGPLIVKPSREDASVGIHSHSVVRDRTALKNAVRYVLEELHQPALVEQFIDGRELYVSLLGNQPPTVLPYHEIDFSTLPPGLPHIVSYAGKWEPESLEFAGTRPVRCLLDEPIRLRVEKVARKAFAALEIRDYGRIDVRLAADGTPYVIDVNPNCDLSDGAGFSRAAGFAGLDYATMIERICLVALERSLHSYDAAPVIPPSMPIRSALPKIARRG